MRLNIIRQGKSTRVAVALLSPYHSKSSSRRSDGEFQISQTQQGERTLGHDTDDRYSSHQLVAKCRNIEEKECVVSVR